MKFILSCLLTALITINVSAQGYSLCKDSLRQPDTYYQCQDPTYAPVCGCDMVTYRNACAAEHWGGLLNNGFTIGWTEGTVCGNFDFDFVPTKVEYNPVQFSVFMKTPGSATLYIYNSFGGLVYTDYFNIFIPYSITSREVDLQSLPIGIYSAIVVVNGDKQYKKFGKVANTLK